MLLRRVRSLRAALLALLWLPRALAGLAALVALRLGGLGHAQTLVEGRRGTGGPGCGGDGKDRCGKQECGACHAVRSPGWIGSAPVPRFGA
jgi:hypothetical protein